MASKGMEITCEDVEMYDGTLSGLAVAVTAVLARIEQQGPGTVPWGVYVHERSGYGDEPHRVSITVKWKVEAT